MNYAADSRNLKKKKIVIYPLKTNIFIIEH